MTEETVHSPDREKIRESVFAKEKTYGEKKYDFIFGNLINFWLNLFASAGFAFWVAHSPKEIKLPFMKEGFVPFEKQKELSGWFSRQFFMKGIENPVTLKERSAAMAEMFTLLIPGHVVMIPSVWLGEKYKASIVEHYNRKHYGDEAMNSPELMARHDQIANERKPTLLGAVMGRMFGTIPINQGIVRLIGTGDNVVNKLSKKIGFEAGARWGGTDKIASDIGSSIGEVATKLAPDTTKQFNEFGEKNLQWSEKQRNNPAMAEEVKGPFKNSVDGLFRLTTMDVMYSYASAAFIHPVLNVMGKFIPGVMYTPKQVHHVAPSGAATTELSSAGDKLFGKPTVHVPHVPRLAEPQAVETQAAEADATPEHHKPHAKVSHAHHESTLHHAHEHAGAQTV